jgi:hypothetical protein
MEIKLNINNDLAARAVQRQPSATPVGPVRDRAAFENLDALTSKLDNIPVVRPDAVARGQELVASADYPPEKTIEGIALLLAAHERTQPESPA